MWTRVELAVRVGRDPSSIKLYENGMRVPTLGVFLSLCDCLGISPVELCRTEPATARGEELEYELGRFFVPAPPRERNT